jgi:hypothetical protein
MPHDEPLTPPLLAAVLTIRDDVARLAECCELKKWLDKRFDSLDKNTDAILKNQKILHDEHIAIAQSLARIEAVLAEHTAEPEVSRAEFKLFNKRKEQPNAV